LSLLNFILSLVFSTAVVLVLVGPGLRKGLNLADEGYLWLGTLGVLEGRIPIRDFRAYDPGRYYWSALAMRFLGRGIFELRLVQAATAVLGLSAGMSVVLLASGSWPGAMLTCLALAAWMHPLYKVIDFSLAVMATLATTLMVTTPDPLHYAQAAFLGGVSFFFGLNHGLYSLGGLSVLLALTILKGYGLAASEAVLSFGTGLAAGFAVPLGYILLVPGLRNVYWRRKVLTVLRRGTTNLSLPIPWLGRPVPRHLAHYGSHVTAFVRACFTLLPLVAAAMVLLYPMLGRQLEPLEWAIVGAASVGVFYLHSAFSRADFPHLAQSVSPIIIAISLWLQQFDHGWLPQLALVLASLRGAYWPLEMEPRRGSLEAVETPGGPLMVDQWTAQHLDEARRVVDNHSQPGDPVMFAPLIVTLYPLLDRRPAVYDTFCVYPASKDEQNAMIDELSTARTRLALILDIDLDGRGDLRFSRTHPMVWTYLHNNMKRMEESPSLYHVFVAKGSADV